MKKILILLTLAILFSSCRSNLYWTKSDFSEQEFLKDRYECHWQSQMLFATQSIGKSGWGMIGPSLASRDNFSNCMRARGYEFIKIDNPEGVVK
jgi:hypothetical protein